MATLNLTATNICTGGNHVTLSLSVDGVERFSATYEIAELVESLSNFDQRDADVFTRILIRLHKIGKTNAQVKTDLLLGLNIVV